MQKTLGIDDIPAQDDILVIKGTWMIFIFMKEGKIISG
jgi:hypothetical protein